MRSEYPYKILELAISGQEVKKSLQDCNLVDINAFGEKYHLVTREPEQARETVVAALARSGFTGFSLAEVAPTLEDVFVALAGEAS